MAQTAIGLGRICGLEGSLAHCLIEVDPPIDD